MPRTRVEQAHICVAMLQPLLRYYRKGPKSRNINITLGAEGPEKNGLIVLVLFWYLLIYSHKTGSYV